MEGDDMGHDALSRKCHVRVYVAFLLQCARAGVSGGTSGISDNCREYHLLDSSIQDLPVLCPAAVGIVII